MRLRTVLGMTAAAWLCLCSLLRAQPAVTPRRQPLAIPILAAPAGQPAPSVDCVVTRGPVVPVSAVAFSPDGKTLAAAGYQEVLLWDLSNARLLKRIGVGQLTDSPHGLAFSKDGRLLAVAEGLPNTWGAVRVFDKDSGQLSMSFQEPKEVLYALAFHPDGKLLAAGGADATVYVWSMDEKKLVASLKEQGEWVQGVSWSANGKFLAAASADKTAQVWEVPSWKPLSKMQQTESVYAAAFSPDGELVALAVGGPEDRAVRIRRRDNAQEVRVMDLAASLPLDAVWCPKPNRIYVPASDKSIKVFDGGNFNLVANLTGHADWVYRVALSPDGTKLASASADGSVKLWSTADNRLLATLLQLAPRTEEWLIVAAQGYLATSVPGSVQWRTANVKTPLDKLPALIERVEVVREAMAGNKVAPLALQ
jgi:WD40 repeat protein